MPTPFPWPAGTIVVCIDGDIPSQYHDKYNRLPVTGEYYTIRSIYKSRDNGVFDGGYGVLLCEIIGAPYPHGGEYGFNHIRFRPAESDHNETEYLTTVCQPCDHQG